MTIDEYSFGSITVNGQSYQKDLILFPDKIKPNWWREDGHSLSIKDLEEVIEYKPDILIIGTGAHGVMQIPNVTKEALEQHHIKLIDEKTEKACEIFNEYIEKGEKVVGAFHLTC